MPWAGNIAKTMTSNGKQFTVTHQMLTAVALPLSFKWLFVLCHFDPYVLLYNKSLNDWSLGEQWILFLSNLNVSLNLISGSKIHCSPWDQSLSVKYKMIVEYFTWVFKKYNIKFKVHCIICFCDFWMHFVPLINCFLVMFFFYALHFICLTIIHSLILIVLAGT